MDSNLKRQLKTVIFADIVDFSKSMAANESSTIQDLEIIENIIDKSLDLYSGNLIKKLGDGFLIAYNSSVNAVESAINIQKQIDTSDCKLKLRMGVHLGDIIHRNDDVYGNGVNIAARVEPLAEPGGICITQAVYQSIQSSIKFDASVHESLKLKNIFEEHTVYKYPKNDNQIKLTENEQKQFEIKKISDLPNFNLSAFGYIYKSFLGLLILLSPNIISVNLRVYNQCPEIFFNPKRLFVTQHNFDCHIDNVYGLYMSELFYNLTNLDIFNYGLSSEILILLMTIIPFFPYMMVRKKRISFNHIKGVLSLLEENIYKLKSPVGVQLYLPKNKNIAQNGITYNLRWWPNLITMGLQNYRIKIDGNSIIVEGPASIQKKLLKVLEAYSE